ncbi:MAG: hypothetical protein LUH63_21755, partial [Parabacteroides sp.]|nr:hypothetical protein [Parabacteroides sp.]
PPPPFFFKPPPAIPPHPISGGGGFWFNTPGGHGAPPPPVVAVLHGIFGFSQSDKNISEYSLKPQLLDLEWAKGRIPLKEGYINLDIRRSGTSYIEIPENCTVSLNLDGKQKPLVFKKSGKYEFACP